ncbi:hypothetical protein RRG08_048028 [Elysia crispata]|uniref:Uncharacterized protein n=1 Tax=Elysia crispata TaxID=231223 RepID=A0AAE0XRT0_9GAST|nr:hypothetical protein RRG08_048028 [Elysia crispata]
MQLWNRQYSQNGVLRILLSYGQEHRAMVALKQSARKGEYVYLLCHLSISHKRDAEFFGWLEPCPRNRQTRPSGRDPNLIHPQQVGSNHTLETDRPDLQGWLEPCPRNRQSRPSGRGPNLIQPHQASSNHALETQPVPEADSSPLSHPHYTSGNPFYTVMILAS